jgi:hypothetical protein
MNGHTSAPWRCDDGVIYGLEGGEEVAVAYATRDASDALTEFDLHNIPRIVACVNACEGIDTGTLTSWGVGGCLDAQRILGEANHALGVRNVELGHQVQAVMRERDAMLVLLQRLVTWNHNANGSGIELGEMLVDVEALLEHGPEAIAHKAPSHKDGAPVAKPTSQDAEGAGRAISPSTCPATSPATSPKGSLAEEILRLEALGHQLAALPWSAADGHSARSESIARLNVQLVSARRELAAIIRRETGLI